MRTLVLENHELRASVLLDKGSDIFQLIFKPRDLDFIWHSPLGYRNPSNLIQSITDLDDAFTDYYGGGWNDVFPNYGFRSENRGVRFGLHGESALLPWSFVAIENEDKGREAVTARLRFDCTRYPLRADKSLTLDGRRAVFEISEDIMNAGEQEVELSWAQHIAFGEPFVGPDLVIDIPAIKAITHNYDMPQARVPREREFDWPFAPGLKGDKVDLSRIPPRSDRVQDDFPIIELRKTQYRLYNKSLDAGLEVSWNRETFPHLWYWLNWGVLDYPWFGRGRTLALEPTTASHGGGLKEEIKCGTAPVLKPGSKIHGEIRVRAFTGAEP